MRRVETGSGSSMLRAVTVAALLAVLLSTMSVTASASHFDDVPADHPFHGQIGWLVGAGITDGFGDGTFRPTSPVTRQAMAAFLYRMEGEPSVTVTDVFDDVSTSHPFAGEISWMVDEGLTTGFSDNTFRPAQPVTRQAAAAFLYRFAGEPSVTFAGAFSDVPASHLFADEIGWAAAAGITTGFGDGTFRPGADVTRQAVAAFLYRFVHGEDPPAPVPSGELDVHFIDAGQGDATLLTHENTAVLVDTGRWQATDVVDYVTSLGIDELDLVVVTHPHADHIGQFDKLVDVVTITETWWSGSTTTSQTFARAVDALERSGAAYEEPRSGDAAQIGSLLIEVANPPEGVNLTNVHDAGLAVRVTFGSFTVLFTGDAEASTENRMVSQNPGLLAADVLQVGHHGSNTSTTPAFLSAVSPTVAVYSAGANNQYGHPHAEVLTRLATAGVEVYGTDTHGTVIITSDGQGWSVTTERRPTGGDTSPGPTPPDEPPPVTDGCGPGQVDINRAGFDSLQQIIHIGPDRAQQILDLRPFSSVDDMVRISGIGPARLADIKAQGVACVG